MKLSLRPAVEYSLTEIAESLTRGFEDYFVPIAFTKESFASMMRLDGVDLNSSQVIERDGHPVGCALVAHRGWTSRLAAMGVAKEARNGGIGRWTMEQLINKSREHGDRRYVLEVIEQNEPGVRLYQGCGFEVVRRLVGYKSEHPETGEAAELEEIDNRMTARVLSEHGAADLPWQASAATIGQMAPPNRSFKLGPAHVLISNPSEPGIAIRSLVVERSEQRNGWAKRIVRALFNKFPDKSWLVPVLFPEEIAPGLFESLGFEQQELSQLQMELNLNS